MNEIDLYQPKLPNHIIRELDRQREHMSHIARLAIEALDEQSQIFSYSVFKVISTMNTVSVIKEVSKANGMTPEIKATIHQMSKQYLQMMELIPSYACSKIVQVLKDVPRVPTNNGLIQNVLDNFTRLLPG